MDIDKNNIRRLDFSLLIVFDELVRHGRTTVVAERLGLSQSAISHALTRLRMLFDDPLFSRRPDGLTPTRRALELAPKIRDLMHLTQDVVGGTWVFDAATSDRLFKMAANDLVSTLFGPPLLAKLAAEAPKAGLTTRFAVGWAAMDALRKNEIDVAVGRFYQVPDEFESRLLFQENFAVVARAGHPTIGGSLDLPTYIALDHLLVSFTGKLTGVVDDALDRQGLKRRVLASVPMFLAALAAVAASDLIATVPVRLAQRFGAAFGLQVLPAPLAIESFPVSLIRLVSARSDLGAGWLAECVAEVGNGLR